MTENDFICRFENFVRKKSNFPSISDAAKHYGVSRQQLYNIFDATVKAIPNDKMLEDMGLLRLERRIIRYYKDYSNDQVHIYS